MNILIAPNNYYVMPGIVMLESLFRNNTEKMDIYIVQSELSDKNKQKIIDFIYKNGGTPHMIELPSSIFKDAPISIHITKESYYRLLAQDFLPNEVTRILYLDLDIIINRSLSNFYSQSFIDDNEERYFVVCEGPGVSQREWEVYDMLNIPKEYKYFNSGVILFNLALLRENFDTQELLDFISDNDDKLKYHDQDTLNALFYNKVKYNDWHIYNQTILHIHDYQESKICKKNACIIHYAGSDKPWNYNYKSWYFMLFWKYAKKAGYRFLFYRTVLRRFFWHLENKKINL